MNDDGSMTPRAESIVSKTPMGRFGQHAELNGALIYLCSDAATHVHGQMLLIDGGMSAWQQPDMPEDWK